MMTGDGQKRAGMAGLIALAACVCLLVLPARAQNTDAQVRAMVEVAQTDMDQLVAGSPAARAVVDGISADCARRLPDDARTPGFCRCAAAATITLWRSGIDGGETSRKLSAYIAAPGATALADLLGHQTPDLYKSACERALRRN
jgi:hypothetical protein